MGKTGISWTENSRLTPAVALLFLQIKTLHCNYCYWSVWQYQSMDHSDLNYYSIINIQIMVNLLAIVIVASVLHIPFYWLDLQLKESLARYCQLGNQYLRPLGPCSNLNLQKGNGWRYPRVSRPTYYLTSCSQVVRPLVYQSSDAGLIPGMSCSESDNTWGKTPNNAAATYHNHELHGYVLICLKDLWTEIVIQGIQTCNLRVTALI